MLDPQVALAAGAQAPRHLAPAGGGRRLLVAGGGGRLGSAVLEAALHEHRFVGVGVLAVPPLNSTLRRLHPVPAEAAALRAFAPDTVLLVFDGERHANGREARFVHPRPAELLPLARQFLAAGVRRLVVVVPHQTATLPAALRAGLATLDETAAAALGLEQLVFLRTAHGARSTGAGHALQRLGAAMLSQLHWMVPQREQPVRTPHLARFVVALALALPEAPPGTRVVSPELMWDWSQPGGGDAVLDAWLHGRAAPVVTTPMRRW
jgi:hypothetical protein